MQLEPSEIIELKSRSMAMDLVLKKINIKISEFDDLVNHCRLVLSESFSLIESDTRAIRPDVNEKINTIIEKYYLMKDYKEIAVKLYDEISTDKKHIDEYLELALGGK